MLRCMSAKMLTVHMLQLIHDVHVRTPKTVLLILLLRSVYDLMAVALVIKLPKIQLPTKKPNRKVASNPCYLQLFFYFLLFVFNIAAEDLELSTFRVENNFLATFIIRIKIITFGDGPEPSPPRSDKRRT